jgi:hypothetical protein
MLSGSEPEEEEDALWSCRQKASRLLRMSFAREILPGDRSTP